MLIILFIAGTGSLMVYFLSRFISGCIIGNLIAVCGDYSFSIMLLHFFSFKLVNLIQCMIYGYPFERIAEFPYIDYSSVGWFVIYILAGCGLPIALSKFYNKILFYGANIYRKIN